MKDLVNERLSRATGVMRESDIDAILLFSGPNQFYFAGSPLGPSDRPAFVMVGKSGAVKIVCPVFERSRVEDEKALGVVSAYEENEDPFQVAARALKGLRPEKVGLDPQLYFEYFHRLDKSLSGVQFTNARDVIRRTRSIKTEKEMEWIRRAADITEEAMEAALDAAEPGTPERVLASMIEGAMVEAGARPKFAIVQFDENSAVPHHEPGGKLLREGSVVLMDCGCSVNGFISDITRTVAWGGEPTEKMREVYSVVEDARRAAFEFIGPGVKLGEIDRRARTVIYKAGYGAFFTHRLGHGLGLEVHEDPYVVEGNDLEAEEGMVFTVEPGIYLPDEFGVRIEDDVAVTSDGCLLLSGPPENLVID